MSSLSQARGRLQDVWHALRQQWQATCGLWNDAVQRHFERDFMQAYEPAILAATREMDSLAALIAQAQREVK